MSHAAKLFDAATALHQAGNLAEAEKTYRKLLKISPADGDGLRLLGGLYLQSGQLAQAVACLEKAVRQRPGDTETLTNLGLALRGLGRLEDAAELYRQALAAQPHYMPALIQLGSLCHDNGRSREALELYGRAAQSAPDDAGAHYHFANGLLLFGRTDDAIAHYRQAVRLKPGYLEAIINLGMALEQAGQSEEAQQWLGRAQAWFEDVLRADPVNTVAINNLGNVLRQQGKTETAIAHYREALRLRPDYIEPAVNLATALRDLGQPREAADHCRQALAHKPDSVGAHINLGVCLQDLMQHAEAIEHFAAVPDGHPSSLDARWNQALSLLALGRYAEGWALYEAGLGIAHMRGDNPSPQRRWNGGDITGRRLLLWCEQGLGDSLQFIRYAELCKARVGAGGKIILLCPPTLRGLFGNSSFIDMLPESVEENDFDCHAPLMSLPYLFGTTLETIPTAVPYLAVGAAKRAKWNSRFKDRAGFKVGLVWAGNPRPDRLNAHVVDRRRSIALETLRPLFAVPGVDFYNLQMGAAAAQIDACGLRDRFTDWMGEVGDFEDTGAIIERLDLVITVDTAVAHLAGGLGKRVWVLSRFDACWRWLQNRPDNPWYPSARVFGQSEPGDWESVITQVKAGLLSLPSDLLFN